MVNKIKYCPGCLRTFEQISLEGCGSQRCPEYAFISHKKLEEKIAKKKEFKILLESFAKDNIMKFKTKNKTIYHVSTDVYGEQDFFFDEDGNLLHWWDKNDANFRGEYMNPLFEKLGIKIEKGNWIDNKFYSKIRKVLKDCGASEKDFNK